MRRPSRPARCVRCLLLDDVDVASAVSIVQDHPRRLTLIDNIDETTIRIKVSTGNFPMLLNPGPTPWVISQAESISSPHGCWYHFAKNKHRATIHGEVDWLYDLFPTARIYLVLSIHPLSLVQIMNKCEVSVLFGPPLSPLSLPHDR